MNKIKKTNKKKIHVFKKDILIYIISTIVIIILLNTISETYISSLPCGSESCLNLIGPSIISFLINILLVFLWELHYTIKLTKKYLKSTSKLKLYFYIIIVSFLLIILSGFTLIKYTIFISFLFSSILVICLTKIELDKNNKISFNIIRKITIILLIIFIIRCIIYLYNNYYFKKNKQGFMRLVYYFYYQQ